MINIEQHSSTEEGDRENLWELTHFNLDNLRELERHLTLSAERLSSTFEQLHKDLKFLISCVDVRKAS